MIHVGKKKPISINGERLYILFFRPPTLPLNSTRSLAFHSSNPSCLPSISARASVLEFEQH